MDVVDAFCRAMRAEGLERGSVDTYRVGLVLYERYLTEQTLSSPCVRDVTDSNVRDFLAHLADSGLSPATRSSRLKALRRFTGWLYAEGIRAEPIRMPRTPRQEETYTPVLTEAQVRSLLKTTTGPDFTDRRDHALLRLFLDSGMRLSEMASLRLPDLGMDTGVAVIWRGKGGKFRVVWFGTKTATAIDRYLRLRATHHKAHGTDRLWLGEQGPLTASGVRQLVYRRGTQANVRLHPHTFRHTFAHRWLAEGGSEGDLMRLAGWSSPTMLRVYGRSAAQERAIEAARQMSLGDRY